MEAFRANPFTQLRQIALVQDRVEQAIVAGQEFGELFQDGHHLFAALAFDHDHRVVVIAEFVDVLDPQPVVVAVGI